MSATDLFPAAAPGVAPTASAVPDAAQVSAPAPIAALSPSRALDFKTCALLFRFRAVDRLPEPPSADAVRGSVVHAVLERLFDLPAADRTLPAAAALVEPQWQRLLDAEPELAALFPESAGDGTDPSGPGAALQAWLGSARALLESYFTLEDPRRLEPAERELCVEAALPSGLRLKGIVDRLDRSPAGDLRVVDYKTGRAPKETFEGKALFQLRFYALVLWRMTGRVPRMLQLIYLGDREVLRYEPDERDLRATERQLDALWTAILRAADAGDWRPRPGPLCAWCSFQALCPAYGGTPPPLPTATTVPG